MQNKRFEGSIWTCCTCTC